jgi:hypothetical protein
LHFQVPSGVEITTVRTLGNRLRRFPVSIQQAIEQITCHEDGVNLFLNIGLVVRDFSNIGLLDSPDFRRLQSHFSTLNGHIRTFKPFVMTGLDCLRPTSVPRSGGFPAEAYPSH